VSQFLGHGEGDQEVGRGQKQARPLALEPVVGVGLTALRTMPVVAGMIAVVQAGALRALEELAPQRRGATAQDLLQDLSLAPRHGGAEACQIIRGPLPEQLMNGRAWTTVAGGRRLHRLPMNLSSRC
jgi:hypothetical protein